MDLARRFQIACSNPSDIVEHLPRLVQLVEQHEASHVIELGTRGGVSTIAWLYGLEKTGGRLTSIDVDPPPDLGGWPHWTFRRSDDLEPALLADLEPAEIVFIDTSHTYEHTCAELDAYLSLVKPGGVIVCHDTELGDEPPFPVKRAVEEFTARHDLRWTNNPCCWGLAEIEVPA